MADDPSPDPRENAVLRAALLELRLGALGDELAQGVRCRQLTMAPSLARSIADILEVCATLAVDERNRLAMWNGVRVLNPDRSRR